VPSTENGRFYMGHAPSFSDDRKIELAFLASFLQISCGNLTPSEDRRASLMTDELSKR